MHSSNDCVMCSFRAIITEEFKVPDKMVGFSKYCGSLHKTLFALIFEL